MSRRVGMVCAGTLLVAAAGCTLDSFRVSFVGTGAPKQVVDGPVEGVSAQLQAGLSDAGIAVLAKRQGEEVRLAGITRSGKVFCLRLKGERAAGGDRTAVTVEWGREADDQFWRTVVRLVTEPPPPDSMDSPDPRPAGQPPVPAPGAR